MKKQLIAIAGSLAITSTAWSTDNLITNSSFEDGITDWNFLSMKGNVKNLEKSSTKENNGDHKGVTMAIEVPEKENLIANKFGAWGRIHKVLTLTTGKTYQVKASAYPNKKFDGIISILVTAGAGTGTKQFYGDGQAYDKWQEIAGEFTATAPDAMIFLNVIGNCGEVSFDNTELFEVVPDTAIVKNGGFEKGLPPWIFDSPMGKVECKVVSTQANEGKNALQMEVREVPSKEASKETETYAWGRLRQEIASLEIGRKYKISVWVMTAESFVGSIAIWTRFGEGTGTKNQYGSNSTGKWVEISEEFTPTQTNGIIYLNIMAGKGIAYFEQVTITPMDEQLKEQIVHNIKDLSSLKQSLIKINPIDPSFKEGLASFLKEYELINEKISHLKDFPISDLDQLSKAVDRLKTKAIIAYNLERFEDDITATGVMFPLWCAGLNNNDTKNMVANSSFEYSTQDNLPDFWGCPGWGLGDTYWATHFEEWTQNYCLDESTAYEGKKSMRIHNPFDRENKDGLCLNSNLLAAKTDVDYTVSAYMKGDHPGMRVNFAGKEITLTREWQRYVCPFVFKYGKGPGIFVLGLNADADSIKIYPLCKGTFWVDAVQFEKGGEATPYESGVRYYQYPPHGEGIKTTTDVYSDAAMQKWRTRNEDPILLRPQYNIITSETALSCKCLIGFQKDQLRNKRLHVSVRDSGGNQVVSQMANECVPSMDVTIKVDALSLGVYTLDARLLNEDGTAMASATCMFRKVPAQKDEAKIDRLSGIAMVNGKPFIPIGFYFHKVVNTEDVRYLVENGFKTVNMTYSPGSKVMEAAMAEASTHEGVRILLHINLGNDIKQLQALAENIKQLNQYPGLLGLNFTDEPIATGRCNDLEILQNMYDKIKAALPNKLVYMNDNLIWPVRVLKHPDASLGSDIISIDNYPVPSPFGSSSPSELFCTTYNAKIAAATARRAGVPFWNVLLGSGYAYGYCREYTASEQEFSTYVSIINGATGILYWNNHPKSKSDWEKIKAMAKEIEFLTPMIASLEATPEVFCSSSQIQLLTKVYDGKVYVMAVNSSLEPINAKISLSGEKNSYHGTVKVLFEDRTLNCKDGAFEDRFEEHQRHVYVFNALSE